MINAAVVGLGTWGKTMVESLAGGSDLMRFTTLQTRTVTPDVEAFAKQHSLSVATATRRCSPIPRSTRSCWRRRRPAICKQIQAAAAAGKHVYCEKPFTFSKKEAEAALDAVRKAKRTVGVGYNRRFHPEMIKLHDRIKAGELGVIQHIEASMTYPNALFLPPTAWRSNKSEAPLRRPCADGRARDRRDDLSRRRDRPGLLPELCARGAERHRRHDLDAVPHEGRHVRLSRHHDHDRRGLQLPGVRLQGLAAARRRDACRRRVLGGAAHAAVRRLQVPAGQGTAGNLGGREARHRPRHLRGVRARGRRRAALPDPARADHPRRRRSAKR